MTCKMTSRTHTKKRKKRIAGDKKKSGGGIARLSSDIPRGGDTIMERPD